MRILAEFPPVYEEVLRAFPAVAGMQPIFAWGDSIYNPHGIAVDRHLMAHERVHGLDQHPRTGGPEAWWRRYIDDPAFRLEQEVEAYRTQLLSFNLTTKDRERRHRYALNLAGHLGGPMYGSMLSRVQAYRRLTR